MTKTKQAGHVEIKEIKLYPYTDTGKSENLIEVDIQVIVNGITIEESMGNGAIYGSMKVFDGIGLLDKMPIRGEEFLKMTYSDYYDIEHTDFFFVYAINTIAPEKQESHDQSMMSYVLHFVSLQKFFTTNISISQAFRGETIKEYAKQVFDEHFIADIVPRKNGWVQRPKDLDADKIPNIDGNTRYIVPDYSPEETLHFFSRNAINNDDEYNSFRFFENREEYMFINYKKLHELKLEKLKRLKEQKRDLLYVQGFGADISEGRQEHLMNEIVSIEMGTRADAIHDINSGAYYKYTIEMDYLNNSLIANEYRYHEEFGKGETKDLHLATSERFIDERLNDHKTDWVVKDYYVQGTAPKVSTTSEGYSIRGEFDTNPRNLGVRENTHYPEIYNNKTVYMHHLEKNMLYLTVHGRNELFAGDLIEVNIPKRIFANKDDEFDNEYLSGQYFVDTIVNVITDNTFLQKLTLVRSGINKSYDE